MVNVLAVVIFAVLAIVILWVVFAYNSFVRLKNQVQNSWAQIDVQLKRRVDLIPNLIETVKGYVKHERGTFEAVTKARTALMTAGDNVKKAAGAENMLEGALKSLFAVAENYPQLKANENFLQLQEELSGTENKISYARQYYNDMVMSYNTKRESFPANFIAKMFNFGAKDLFEIAGKEREVPKVSF